jgi:hypothetical protein
MTPAIILAAMLAPAAAPATAPAEGRSAYLPREGSSTRWDWRNCTRLSTDAQLRSRPLSMEYETVAARAFMDCEPHFRKVARTQSPDDLAALKAEQTQLIKADVETFYIDRATGQI